MKVVEKETQELEEKKIKLLQQIVFFLVMFFFFNFAFSLGFSDFVVSPVLTLCCRLLTVLTHVQHAENYDKEVFIKAIFTNFIAFVFDK